MHLSITFKNIDSSEYLKNYAQEKLDRLDKLLDHPGNADLVLRVEHQSRIAEINFKSNHLSIQAKEENTDMHAAIDLVTDKLRRQITKLLWRKTLTSEELWAWGLVRCGRSISMVKAQPSGI